MLRYIAFCVLLFFQLCSSKFLHSHSKNNFHHRNSHKVSVAKPDYLITDLKSLYCNDNFCSIYCENPPSKGECCYECGKHPMPPPQNCAAVSCAQCVGVAVTRPGECCPDCLHTPQCKGIFCPQCEPRHFIPGHCCGICGEEEPVLVVDPPPKPDCTGVICVQCLGKVPPGECCPDCESVNIDEIAGIYL